MIVIGLAGGTGQGKSTFGGMLRQLAEVDNKADLETSYPISEVINEWLSTWPPDLELGVQGDVVALANKLLETLPEIIRHRTGKFTTYGDLRIGLSDESIKVHQRLIDYLETWLRLGPEERHVQLPLPITPENKGLHRALLQWLGGMTVSVVSPTIWSDLIDNRIKDLAGRGYALLTVGGIRYDHDAQTIHNNGGLIVHLVRPEAEQFTEAAVAADVTETSSEQVKPDVEIVNNGTLEQLQAVATAFYQDIVSGTVKSQYKAA